MSTQSIQTRCLYLLLTAALVLGFATPAFAATPPRRSQPLAASDLLQFEAGGQIVGFQSTQVVLAAFDHALRVEFVDAANVAQLDIGASLCLPRRFGKTGKRYGE